MPIADLVQQCLQQFNSLQHNEEIYEIEKIVKIIFGESFDRFTIWTNNIGAHRSDTSSLEYRLRDASHIKQIVEDTLQDIVQSLSDANGILLGDKIPWEKDIQEDLLNERNEDIEYYDNADSNVYLKLDSDYHAESNQNELHQLSTYLLETVKCLLRLSITIKNPAPFDRFLRSRDIDIKPFEQFDIGHTKSKFPLAEEFLLQRLGRGNSKRRAYFKYREEHREKLEKDLGPDNQTVASSLPGVVDAIQNSDQFEDDTSVTSYARTDITTSNSISVPLMPREAESGEPFECPFCFNIVIVRSQNEWK
jgi:hypothetical protein